MPLPPGTLNQALNQLPQFLLTLNRLQEGRSERIERARRANEQETARKESFELNLVRLFGQADPDVQVAGSEGFRKSLDTRAGRRAGEVAIDMAEERQRQKRGLEREQSVRDQFKRAMDLLNLQIKAADLGLEGAEEQVLRGLARITGEELVPQDTTISDKIGPLDLDLRGAGFGLGIQQVTGRKDFPVGSPTELIEQLERIARAREHIGEPSLHRGEPFVLPESFRR